MHSSRLYQIEQSMLSIIVIFHNMCREAERTLHTLSAAYQTGVSDADYEVIAIDNGSSQPLNPAWVSEFGTNFAYYFFPLTRPLLPEQ